MSSAKRFVKQVDWYLTNVYPKGNAEKAKLQVGNHREECEELLIPCNFRFPAVLCAAKDLEFTGEITILHEWYIPEFPLKTTYVFNNGEPVSYESHNDIYVIHGENFIQHRIPETSDFE